MEEILASIRRIIADDDALPLMRRPGPSLVARQPIAVQSGTSAAPERSAEVPRHPLAPAPASPGEPPVHLVAVPQADAGPANLEDVSQETVAVHPDASFGTAPQHSPEGGREMDRIDLRGAMPEDGSEPMRTAAPSGINPMERVSEPLLQEPEDRGKTPLVSPATDASVASSFQSLATSMFLRDSDLIARMARDMLRPMLKQWLDDNLPVMVERLVRAEIERVARGGR
jgi:cell pole-organizing protein PopZ